MKRSWIGTLLKMQAPRTRSMQDSSIYKKEYIPSEACEPQYQVKRVHILFRSSETEYVQDLLKTEFVPSSHSGFGTCTVFYWYKLVEKIKYIQHSLGDNASENGDIYHNISIAPNIEGFQAYHCIIVVYRREVLTIYPCCCIGVISLLVQYS